VCLRVPVASAPVSDSVPSLLIVVQYPIIFFLSFSHSRLKLSLPNAVLFPTPCFASLSVLVYFCVSYLLVWFGLVWFGFGMDGWGRGHVITSFFIYLYITLPTFYFLFFCCCYNCRSVRE